MTSREELRKRKRRIIWNNDGDDLTAPATCNAQGSELRAGKPGYDHFRRRLESPDDYLRVRMKGKLEGTQVESIFYCGYCLVPNWEFPDENTRALGPDPLKHAVDYAHSNGMEFFYSFRMNDIHLAVHQGTHYWSKFRMQNLHLLQGEVDREWFEEKVLPWVRGETEKHPLTDAWEAGRRVFFRFIPGEGRKPSDARTWAAYDWGLRAVRDYYLGLVQEACRRYDLDGIEFDWGRTPPFFKMEHRTNGPVMTDFMCQVRRWLDEWGRQRGRPLLMATRVPDSPTESRNLGLDAGTWLREGLIDILVAGFGARPFSYPLGEWVRLGHEHGVPVYGCIENGLPGMAKKEVIRATAQRYWEAGVNGVYLYNHFYEENKEDVLSIPGWPLPMKPEDTLYDIGDPARLRRLDKTYCVDMYGGVVELPVRLSTESGPSTAVITFEIAEDPAEASDVTLQMHWAADVDILRVSLRLNGAPVPGGRPFVQERESDDRGWYAHEVTSLRKGVNTLEVTAQPSDSGADKLLLKQVRAAIRYAG